MITPDPIVKGNGPDNASIMVVMDYPSKEEWQKKQAGVGSTGRLISQYFSDNGWDFSRVFKTCYLKQEFHLPKSKKAQEDAVREAHESIAPLKWGQILAEEIATVRPNVIVPVGELSTQYVSGRKPVGKLRGSVLPVSEQLKLDAGSLTICPYIRVIPVIHPRDIFQNWTHNIYTQLDYAKIVKYKDRTDLAREDYNLWICRKAAHLWNWWQRAQKGEYLTLDIETFFTFITCIGFCHDGREAVCVPLIEKNMGALERGLLLRLVSQILRHPIPKVNQNIKYDHHMLEDWGFWLENIAGDTMLLGHCIYPELPKGLDFYTSIYTDVAYYKDDGRDFTPKEGWDTLFYYNAKDALTAWQIYKRQVADAKDIGVWDFYKYKIFPLYTIYKKMEDRGIRIDQTERQVLGTKYSEILQVRHNYLISLTGRKKHNFNSPKQNADLVYNDLKFPPQYKTDHETGKKTLTTDEETLEELVLNYATTDEQREILWTLIWCKKIYKILGYIKVPFHMDGRMRTNTKLTGSKGGRVTNSETVDRIWFRNVKTSDYYNPRLPKSHEFSSVELGLSFQTIPKHGFEIGTINIGKELRRMYCASPGYSFVEGDGGQAEARVVCILADDAEALKEMNRKDFRRNKFKLKDDLHTKTAMLVLQKGFDEITESDRQDFGKKPRHAGNYDMGAARLSLMAHIPLATAQTVLTRFHSNSSKIRENFHQGIRSLVSNKRQLATPHGRVRQFFDRINNDTFKEAYSFIPQAVVSDHTKCDTLIPLQNIWCRDDKAYFLSESHDSLLFEVKNECVPEFSADFKRIEEEEIHFTSGSFISEIPLSIPLEVKTGDNWYDMHELKF